MIYDYDGGDEIFCGYNRYIQSNKFIKGNFYFRKIISEIIFQSKDDKEYQEILRNIKKTIEENSFETAASIYSISDSSKNGGKIGWVNMDIATQFTVEKIIRSIKTLFKVS